MTGAAAAARAAILRAGIREAFEAAFPGRQAPQDSAEALRLVSGAAQLSRTLQEAITDAYMAAHPTWAIVDPLQCLQRMREGAQEVADLAEERDEEANDLRRDLEGMERQRDRLAEALRLVEEAIPPSDPAFMAIADILEGVEDVIND